MQLEFMAYSTEFHMINIDEDEDFRGPVLLESV